MNKQLYYRLIALWALSEALLGGIIHGFRIPVSGLVVGSSAVVCICLIAWYVPVRGAIIKATIIVAIFKMMLSPPAPPMAYVAVFFQGLLGEVLFFNRKFFRLSCILLAVLSLLESGLQRILVLTVVYSNDLWKVINDFINKLTGQKAATNYSLLIGSAYVLLHLVTGLLVGWWAGLLPKRVERWKSNERFALSQEQPADIISPVSAKRKKKRKTGLFIAWLLLIALYVQSYFNMGKPLLPAHISLRILLRSIIIVLGWIFIIGPLVKQLLYNWLQRKQSRWKNEVQEVLQLLPATRQLVSQSWKHVKGKSGWKQVNEWTKTILVNALAVKKIYILTAPIQSGKTTSLVNWSAGRDNVYGILTPVVNGRRMFMNAHTKELFPMEAAQGEKETLAVGRFVFSKNNFDKAIQVIKDGMDKSGWLIIDEIGPIELRGEGFHNVLKEVLDQKKEKVVLVVREGLQQQAADHFRISVSVISNINEIEQ